MPKSKNELSKKILKKLFIGSTILIAAQSPYFWLRFYQSLFAAKPFLKKPQIKHTFYNMRKRGLIGIEKRGRQCRVFLTEKGKKKAEKYQIIDESEIKKPRKWDERWRIIIFDIPENLRIRRDAFRVKLKEFGFYQLQKSVWIYPFPCEKQIKILREFFGLNKRNLTLFTVKEIENEDFLKKIFKI